MAVVALAAQARTARHLTTAAAAPATQALATQAHRPLAAAQQVAAEANPRQLRLSSRPLSWEAALAVAAHQQSQQPSSRHSSLEAALALVALRLNDLEHSLFQQAVERIHQAHRKVLQQFSRALLLDPTTNPHPAPSTKLSSLRSSSLQAEDKYLRRQVSLQLHLQFRSRLSRLLSHPLLWEEVNQLHLLNLRAAKLQQLPRSRSRSLRLYLQRARLHTAALPPS